MAHGIKTCGMDHGGRGWVDATSRHVRLQTVQVIVFAWCMRSRLRVRRI
jgi:hypothetical protein